MITKRRFLQLAIAVAWLMVLIGLAGVFLALRWYNSNLQPVDNSQTAEQRFEVVHGASLNEIAISLEEEGLIRDAAVFKWHMKFQGQVNRLQAGVFELSPAQYASEIAVVLVSGLQANVYVTIYPAQHLAEVETSLVEQGFDPLDTKNALRTSNYADHRVMQFIGHGGTGTLEGYLAPESFAVNQFSADSAESVVRRSLDIFMENLTEEIEAGILENFESVHQGVILASIIEKEVPPADRAQAAQVLLKRLEVGDRLGADSTFVYASQVGSGSLNVNNPSLYNTRVHTGLPPGPISNVSKSSLQAVAFPAEGSYYFFLSGDDGRTYFNETLEGHIRDRDLHCVRNCQLPSADD